MDLTIVSNGLSVELHVSIPAMIYVAAILVTILTISVMSLYRRTDVS